MMPTLGVIAALLFGAGATRAQPGPAPVSAAADPDRLTGEELVNRWLAAQNRGDFAAYQALYAQRFTGTKRIGKQVKARDRAAWMKDRKAMFKARMTVSASERTYTRDGATLIIELTQSWEQGTFADEGRKRLVIDLRPAAGPILSEEMLTSRVLPSREACIRALFPDARRGRTGPDAGSDRIKDVELVDLGTELFVCRVDHQSRGDQDVTVELGLIKRGRAWTVVDRRTYLVETAPQAPTRDDEVEKRESLALGMAQISKQEAALLLEQEERLTGPMQDDGSRTVEMLRATPGGFVRLMSHESRWANGEATRKEMCDLSLGPDQRAGFFDVQIHCVTTVGHWHAEDPADNGEDETEETFFYRWNGTGYAKQP